jgi:4'-phosphopantetheinyl transferase EntD
MKSANSRNNLKEDQKGNFQSLVRFTSGNEELATGLVLFSSLNDGELNDKALRLLHPEEIKTGGGYGSDIRRRSYIHGRIAGKMAIQQVFPEIPSAGIHIATGSSGDPVCENLSWPYGISIAHAEVWNAGLCFPLSFLMGIDVDSINEKNRPIITSVLNNHEKELCKRSGDILECLHVLWTAKEAAGKAIRLGFRVPVEWYEIDNIETVMTWPHVIRRCQFKHLSVFMALSVTIPQGILSIAFPAEKKTDQAMISLLEMKTISATH